MSLKIMLDPILTARDPARCSTYIQFYTFVTTVLSTRRDVFFYWPVPEWVTEDERKWLPQDQNVRYFSVKQHRDRMNEYIFVHDDMKDALAFYGDYWDFDILVTVRTGMVPMYKMNMISPRQSRFAWTKQVWVIDEMPLMGFKKSVAMVNEQVQDLMTLTGYLASDAVFVVSYHEKREILQAARQWFPPSRVQQIDKVIRETVPAQKEGYALKDKTFWFRPGEKQFCVAYVGRLMAAQSNLDKVYGAMTNHWILKGSKNVRLLVLTVSTGGQAAWPPDHIELQQAPREEFWRIAREEMHLLIIMHEDGGFSLSLIEPMMMGVPAIILDAPWSRMLLGNDYPFFAKSELDAYALMKMFYEDFEGMYSKFASWFEAVFVPLFKRRFKEDLLYGILSSRVNEVGTDLDNRFRDVTADRDENAIVKAMLNAVGDASEFRMFEVMHQLADSKVLLSLQRKLKEGDRDKRGLVWSTAWNEFRLLLKAHHGWEDASVEVGHFRRAT